MLGIWDLYSDDRLHYHMALKEDENAIKYKKDEVMKWGILLQNC